MSKGYGDLKVIHDLPRMSRLKAWRNRTETEKRLTRPAPGQIQLILSDLCNHDCNFCAYRLSGYSSNENFADEKGNNNPNRMIPEEKAFEIVRDAAALGVRGMQFTGGGEPTVHPGHLRVMREALRHDLACGLVTNGCLLREGWRDVLPSFQWVRISMDAGNADDYGRIRSISPRKWDHMLGNLRALREEIDRQGTDCVLGASFIVTKDNWQGIASAAKAAKENGAAYLRVGAFYNPGMETYYNDPEMMQGIEDQLAEAREEWSGVFDQFTKRLEYMSRKPTHPFCGYQHVNVYVGGDQKVYRCCEYAYNDHGFVGDLSNQSFREWWDSQDADERYACFDATKCFTCPFHTKNELIEFMTRDDISEMHPEFP